MGRTLILIPLMYTREQLKTILSEVPEDYESKSEEFWNYVEEKLKPMVSRISTVYLEALCEGGSRGLELIGSLEKSQALVRRLIETGSRLEASEDEVLVVETESWAQLIRSSSNPVLLELYRDNMEERDRYVADRVNQTLKDGEIGVILLDPSRNVQPPEDTKLIRMCPFDPKDYLNSWSVRLRLRKE